MDIRWPSLDIDECGRSVSSTERSVAVGGMETRDARPSNPALFESLANPDLSLELDTDLGMNLISSTFDIVVVNRASEKLYGKPMVELLGKKCYAEFEKRESICLHCPGVEALSTGQPYTKENEGIRDDWTRFAVLCTAYPVLGPVNKPVGFIEVERDITGRKGEEKTSTVLNNLRFALAKADDCSWALRYSLDAALSLDGVESGCAFLVDQMTGGRILVSRRGFSNSCVNTLEKTELGRSTYVKVTPAAEALRGATMDEEDSHTAIAAIRVAGGNKTAAMLFLGLAGAEGAPSIQVALEALADITANAVNRIEAERAKREQRARMKSVIGNLPVATWCLDKDGKVTIWNRMAENVFGYPAEEILNNRFHCVSKATLDQLTGSPLGPGRSTESRNIELKCSTKAGRLALHVVVASFRGVIDDISEIMVIAAPSPDVAAP